jgi:hypothetical protein
VNGVNFPQAKMVMIIDGYTGKQMDELVWLRHQ